MQIKKFKAFFAAHKTSVWWVLAGFLAGVLIRGGYLAYDKYQADQLRKKIVNRYTKDVLEKPKDIKIPPTATEAAKMRFPIIMYHYVEYVKDPGDKIRRSLDINPGLFSYQLERFKAAGYEMHFIKEMSSILSGKEKVSTRSAFLTFDDGYEDFYTYAFPILKKLNMKATIYIIYDFIGRQGFLSLNELKELAASGLVEIGSHTLDHAYLKHANINYERKQIFDSKRKLEKDLGIKIETFAYPYGAFDNDSLSLVKEASYSAAVSVISGTIQSEANVYFLSRLRPGFLAGPNMINTLEHFPR